MAPQHKSSSDATMTDLMDAVTDIQARIIRMESKQTQQADRLDQIDSRVAAVEKTERGFPWKLLAIVSGAVGLLLIPTVSTLITVGRRDEQITQSVAAMQAISADVDEIGRHVDTIAQQSAAQAERVRTQQERIETLEDRIESVRQDSRRR